MSVYCVSCSVSERTDWVVSGLKPTHQAFEKRILGWRWYQDWNSGPTNLDANDFTTASSRPVGALYTNAAT